MFHVGDKVYDVRFGEGIVADIDRSSYSDYIIYVEFFSTIPSLQKTYSNEGYASITDLFPSLFKKDSKEKVWVDTDDRYILVGKI